jgi:diguanylate cyclase (GGDEF)-like protein
MPGELMEDVLTIAVATAVAVAAFVAVAVIASRYAAARSERRFEAVLEQLDDHMQSVSRSLQRTVERSEDLRRARSSELEITLDLAVLLRLMCAEAVSRTSAQAAAVRVLGPGETYVVASDGVEEDAALLEGTLGPPGSPPFRTLTINWSYGPTLEGEPGAYRSALVVPVVESGVGTGALVAYALTPGAFLPEHADTLEALVEEAAPGLTNARRFAEAELRAVTDALTGARNRRGYDEELEREIARARRTERPLSLLILDLDDFNLVNARFDYPGGDLVLREFAGLLMRTARATDTVCRRGGDEFAILLAETSGDEGSRVYARLGEAIAATEFTHVGRVTLSAGLVQWRPNETAESLDARASAAVNRSKRGGKNRLEAELP